MCILGCRITDFQEEGTVRKKRKEDQEQIFARQDFWKNNIGRYLSISMYI